MNNNHPSKEKTLVVVKPDGLQRSLVGEVIKRIEQTGLKLVGIKLVVPDEEFVEKHYMLEDGWLEAVGNKSINGYKKAGRKPPIEDPIEAGQFVLNTLKKYMTAGPVVATVWQGANSVGVVRKLVGGSEPMSSDVGTIRGDFMVDSYTMANDDGRALRNVVHATGTQEEAKREIELWFDEKELINYRLVQEQILYDVNIDGILE